ncbi:hypothetical protein RUM44_000217 [Polyplax serrata]|uniref:Uncharacterized protein n=1 Tax=Polyplax serrata TaxID=468196 RepID=A0ABR1B4V2_POLSC
MVTLIQLGIVVLSHQWKKKQSQGRANKKRIIQVRIVNRQRNTRRREAAGQQQVPPEATGTRLDASEILASHVFRYPNILHMLLASSPVLVGHTNVGMGVAWLTAEPPYLIIF